MPTSSPASRPGEAGRPHRGCLGTAPQSRNVNCLATPHNVPHNLLFNTVGKAVRHARRTLVWLTGAVQLAFALHLTGSMK